MLGQQLHPGTKIRWLAIYKQRTARIHSYIAPRIQESQSTLQRLDLMTPMSGNQLLYCPYLTNRWKPSSDMICTIGSLLCDLWQIIYQPHASVSPSVQWILLLPRVVAVMLNSLVGPADRRCSVSVKHYCHVDFLLNAEVI